MIMFWVWLFTIFVVVRWLIIPFIAGFLGYPNIPEGWQPTAPETTIDEEDVTVGDMVLHDMMNESDVYDIGVIDFND